MRIIKEKLNGQERTFYIALEREYLNLVGKDFIYKERFNLGNGLAQALMILMDPQVLAEYVPRDTAIDIIDGFYTNTGLNLKNLRGCIE